MFSFLFWKFSPLELSLSDKLGRLPEDSSQRVYTVFGPPKSNLSEAKRERERAENHPSFGRPIYYRTLCVVTWKRGKIMNGARDILFKGEEICVQSQKAVLEKCKLSASLLIGRISFVSLSGFIPKASAAGSFLTLVPINNERSANWHLLLCREGASVSA